jgi:hypothetical protein
MARAAVATKETTARAAVATKEKMCRRLLWRRNPAAYCGGDEADDVPPGCCGGRFGQRLRAAVATNRRPPWPNRPRTPTNRRRGGRFDGEVDDCRRRRLEEERGGRAGESTRWGVSWGRAAGGARSSDAVRCGSYRCSAVSCPPWPKTIQRGPKQPCKPE